MNGAEIGYEKQDEGSLLPREESAFQLANTQVATIQEAGNVLKDLASFGDDDDSQIVNGRIVSPGARRVGEKSDRPAIERAWLNAITEANNQILSDSEKGLQVQKAIDEALAKGVPKDVIQKHLESLGVRWQPKPEAKDVGHSSTSIDQIREQMAEMKAGRLAPEVFQQTIDRAKQEGVPVEKIRQVLQEGGVGIRETSSNQPVVAETDQAAKIPTPDEYALLAKELQAAIKQARDLNDRPRLERLMAVNPYGLVLADGTKNPAKPNSLRAYGLVSVALNEESGSVDNSAIRVSEATTPADQTESESQKKIYDRYSPTDMQEIAQRNIDLLQSEHNSVFLHQTSESAAASIFSSGLKVKASTRGTVLPSSVDNFTKTHKDAETTIVINMPKGFAFKQDLLDSWLVDMDHRSEGQLVVPSKYVRGSISRVSGEFTPNPNFQPITEEDNVQAEEYIKHEKDHPSLF